MEAGCEQRQNLHLVARFLLPEKLPSTRAECSEHRCPCSCAGVRAAHPFSPLSCQRRCVSHRMANWGTLDRSFHFGWLKEELLPALCKFQELFSLLLSWFLPGLKLSFLSHMYRSVFSQKTWGTPLQIFVLPLFCPVNLTYPWLFWILFFVSSTQ